MKAVPFSLGEIREIIKTHPTPFHIYDEAGIVANARNFYKTFEWAPGLKNYYAVKALPNPAVVTLLKEEGMGVDCSSLAELVIAERTGFKGEEIMFTSNDTSKAEFVMANELGAVINLDDMQAPLR